MAKDRKKLQKKRAQKAAKVKSKKAQHKQHGGAPISMRIAFQAPLYQCWEPQQLFRRDGGLGSVIITRKTDGHRVLMAVFLIDAFCLGVKNAFVKLFSESEYRFFLRELRTRESLKSISPACARKLVEGAEAYARDLGFEPHKDYHTAKKVFGDIDTEECSTSFEFGLEGKPLYFAGPYDKQKFRDHIMKTLTDKLGPDGFDFIMPLGEPPELFLE